MNALPDIERARFNMIEQQIRPWEVLDQSVLDLLSVVKREDFAPAEHRALAFVDMEIPLRVDGRETGETMLAPKIEARLLQDLAVRTNESVLEIGSGSGYMAALLAHRAKHVTTVEVLPELQAFAEANLKRAGISNVTVEHGDGARGYPKAGKVDVIVISGGLPVIPESFVAQLQIGGRLAAFVGTAPVMSAEIVTRTGDDTYETTKLFETLVRPLRNAVQPTRFKF